jgi:hypothetical protein
MGAFLWLIRLREPEPVSKLLVAADARDTPW